MFQRFTSLFFSTPPPPEDLNCPRAFVSEKEEMDGWLIIDLPDSYAAPPSPGAAPAPAPAGRPPPAPSLMDESWFVTPPACFTAEGPELGPTRLQSSPLEDLLIEHPSMSVYVTSSTIVLEPGPPSPHPDADLPDGDLSDGAGASPPRAPGCAPRSRPSSACAGCTAGEGGPGAAAAASPAAGGAPGAERQGDATAEPRPRQSSAPVQAPGQLHLPAVPAPVQLLSIR
ncbi:tumor protein p53-inducible nuclear protein 2 isoform 4-T4 [Rhynchonycteris naso]